MGLFSSPAKADTFRTEGANDFYFELESGTTFTARATAQVYGIDSQLWLYDSSNTVVAVNDDYFGLDSYISYSVQQNGVYRMRTSVCCGDPDRWYNESYTVETSSQPTNVPPTTTLPPYFNAVENLTATANEDGSVDLNWEAPTASNVDVYAYSVSFYDLDEIGGTASGGWGVWTNQGTTYSLAEYMFSGSNPVTTGFGPVRFGIKAGNQSCFSSEGVGPCVYGPEVTVDATVIDPTPPSATEPEPETTTTQPATTTTTEPEPTTTTSTTTTSTTTSTTVVPTTMLQTTTTELPSTTTSSTTQAPVVTQPDVPLTTVPTSTTLFSTTTSRPQQTTTLPSTTTSSTTTSTTIVNTTTTLDIPEEANVLATSILANSDNPAELSAAVDNAVASVESPEELASIVSSLLDEPLTDDQFSAVIDAVFTESLTTEELSAALDAVFAEPISDEKFTEVLSAVLGNPLDAEQFTAVVDILESDSVSEEQVSLAVDNILENGITDSQATDLATSPKVLESIDPEQASSVFEQIPVSDLTTEEEKALVETVSDAPTKVKNAFENTIDIFGAGLDEYVAVGSSVNVGTRRVVIAAIGVVTSITVAVPPVPTAPIGSGGGSSSPSGGSNAGTGGSRQRRLK